MTCTVTLGLSLVAVRKTASPASGSDALKVTVTGVPCVVATGVMGRMHGGLVGVEGEGR